LRQRELESFDEKAGYFDEMDEKGKKQRKMSFFIWNEFK